MSPEICGANTGADTDDFRITKGYEAGDWPALSSIASKLGYPESEARKVCLAAASRASIDFQMPIPAQNSERH